MYLDQVWNIKMFQTKTETYDIKFSVFICLFCVLLNLFNNCRNLKKLLYYEMFKSAVYLRGHLLYPVTSSQVVWLSALSFNEYSSSHLLCFILHQSTRIRSRPAGCQSDRSSAAPSNSPQRPHGSAAPAVCAESGLVFSPSV